MYKYPKDLVAPLRAAWPEWRRHESDAPSLPDDVMLTELLETLYHASFTADEQRRTALTAVICEPDAADDAVVFSAPRPFSTHELMRLAPVAGETNILIGVTCSGMKPIIWGICSWAFMQLTIGTTGPGVLVVGRNDLPHITLRRGRIDENFDPGVFATVSDFLSSANAELWTDVNFPGGSWSPELVVYPRYL
jgi:hypothetical protein